MSTLQEKKGARLKFLHQLYEETDGNEMQFVDMWKLGEKLGFDKEMTDLVVQYLESERLMNFVVRQGVIQITHCGVLEVERALENPDEPTHYFPPAIQVINVGTAIGSPIQQVGGDAVQTTTVAFDEARAFVARLREELPKLELQEEHVEEIEAQLDIADAQLRSKYPDRGILRRVLEKVQSLFQNTAAVGYVIEKIPELLDMIPL
jgi:hypothetical protein